MKSHLNIAFFGSSLVSAYWNGAATYYRGILRALAERGHHVTFYEPDAYDRQAHRDMPDPDWANVVVYAANSSDAVLSIVQQARDADLIVKASGVGVYDELLEAAVLELKSPRNTVVFWDVDAPATLDRLGADADDPFRVLVPHYDLILTNGGGEPVIDAYESFGAARCVPIYNALDPRVHFPVSAESRFQCDLAFLGNRVPDRERRVDELFIDVAAALPSCKFLLGGSGWGDRPLPANIAYAGHVFTRDHNAFNSTPSAVLNINRESMARYGFYPPARIFEAAGAGACLITDAWEGIEMFLDPGDEVLVANDGDEVASHLESLTPELCREIGDAAMKRIQSEHTYAHRVIQLEELLEGRDAWKSQPMEARV